jgi:hypothetical protein
VSTTGLSTTGDVVLWLMDVVLGQHGVQGLSVNTTGGVVHSAGDVTDVLGVVRWLMASKGKTALRLSLGYVSCVMLKSSAFFFLSVADSPARESRRPMK